MPLALALLLAAIACVPAIRTGTQAVQGQNGDAVLAVGTGNLLLHAPPDARVPELALDRVPPLWRSKLPIYYGLAAVARLSGQPTDVAFTATAGVVLALATLGFFLFALDGLGLPVLAALAAMLIVGLDRMVLNTTYGPYFNQLWALFALPFALLFGWLYLRDPDRRSAGLAALFVALALFTYPLLLPFPAVFLAVIAWRRRRERGWWRALRLPAPRSAGVRYVVLALLAVPVAAVLVRGVVEKAVPGLLALAPGSDLSAWSGNDFLPFYPFGWFFGISAPPLVAAPLVAGLFAAALYGAAKVRRDGGIALALVGAGAILGGVYLVIRGEGELFHFKALSFAGPLVVVLAVAGLAALPRRGVAVGVLATFAFLAADSARDAASNTYEQTPKFLMALRTWDQNVPLDQTIRIDVPPSGWQLWSWYLMPRHRLSASSPLGGFFPHPPFGLKADLALVGRPRVRPPDAIGPPIRQSPGFALYRLRPRPGFDISSQALVYE